MKTKYSPKQEASDSLVLREHPGPLPPVADSQAMVRTQIYLSRAEYDFLQAEARRRDQAMAAVIRSFVDEKMKMPDEAWVNNPMLEPTPKDPGFALPEDAAINHDHYLYGTPKKYLKKRGRWVLVESPEAAG